MATAANEGAWRNGRLQLIDNQVDARAARCACARFRQSATGASCRASSCACAWPSRERAPVLAVTERAIGTDQNKKFVMVVGEDNKAAYREVTLGAMTDDLRIVTSGLDAGERIVVNGLQRVRPGDVVAPEPVAMDGRPCRKRTPTPARPIQSVAQQ